MKNAFIELRRDAKDKETDYTDKEKYQLVEEKLALQSTIVSLTDEIEELSEKNEEFLKSLQSKDFYQDYQKVWDELKNLKSAHAILINMIKDDEIQVQTNHDAKSTKVGDADDLIKDTSFIIGSDLSKLKEDSKEKENNAPLQEIDSNKGRNAGISSLLSCNAFGGMLKNGRLKEDEIDLKTERNIKNNVEFLSSRLENVDINFLKKNSP